MCGLSINNPNLINNSSIRIRLTGMDGLPFAQPGSIASVIPYNLYGNYTTTSGNTQVDYSSTNSPGGVFVNAPIVRLSLVFYKFVDEDDD